MDGEPAKSVSSMIMKKPLYVILVAFSMLILGASIGYFYKERSVALAHYDNHLVVLSSTLLMMDALRHKKYHILQNQLAAEIEGRTSGMAILYNKYKFAEGDYLRCVLTRKARSLYEKKMILASREELEKLGYPYDLVMAYFESECEGGPSQDDWTAVDKEANK